MKREFLKGLGIEGLTDEVIEKIMAENGKDIEATKTKADKSQEIENLKSQLSEKDKLIEEANSQIENFKGMDVEGIKKAADEYKTKYEQSAADLKAKEEVYQKQLADQQYDFRVKEYLGQHKFTNDFVKDAFEKTFKEQGFKVGEDGKFLGADDYIKSFSEKNQGVFAPVEAPKPNNEPSVQFAAATSGGQAPTKGMSLLDAMKAGNAGQNVDLGQVGKFAVQQQ